MKNYLLKSALLLISFVVFTQCKPKEEYKEIVSENPNLHTVIVKEIQNASAYTYLLVTEGEKEYWIAIPLTDVEVGKTYTYEGGMEMKNFESKDLKRTFESVFFVESLMDPNAPVKTDAASDIQSETETTANPIGEKEVSSNSHSGSEKVANSGVTSTKLSDGITLAKGAISLHDLFSGKDKLAGKTVILTGKVVKFNPEIMSKNWIHLQDGTSFKGLNDILITTLAKLKVDEIVTLKGVVVLNKDFGAGYKYDILIEDAVILK